MASNTVALEAIDQTAEPLCANIALTEPAISINLKTVCSALPKYSKQNMDGHFVCAASLEACDPLQPATPL
jgi:hypothetical protein